MKEFSVGFVLGRLPPRNGDVWKIDEGVVSRGFDESAVVRRYHPNNEAGTTIMMVRRPCDVNHLVGTSMLDQAFALDIATSKKQLMRNRQFWKSYYR
jgi:3-methyladenine DNA glycosylase Mpg